MRRSIFSFVSLFLISSGLLLVMVFNTSPLGSNEFYPVVFFSASFISICSLLIVACYAAYKMFKKSIGKETGITIIRRSVLISFILVGLTVLNVFCVLNLLSGVTFFVALTLTEVFFVNQKIEKKNEQ